jgi:hypothetical protein
MVENTRLKIRRQGHLQWNHLPANFHENPPMASKVVGGHRQKHRQAGELTSLLSFLNDSRLKK